MKAYKTAIILTLIFLIPFGAARAVNASPDTFRTAFAFLQKEESTVQKNDPAAPAPGVDRAAAAVALTKASGRTVSEGTLQSLSDDTVSTLLQAAEGGTLTAEAWHSAAGYTLNALLAKTEQTADGKWLIDKGSNGKDYYELGFVGDMNFTEDGYVMPHALEKEDGVLGCIDKTFRTEMKNADILLANNEFTYSDRGTPISGKQYTFRAKPDTAHYMNDLGVDLVSLANNHTYDYGEDSFNDTLSTLRKNKMPYVGAGKNLEEASRPVCFLINGYKVAFLAASRAEDLQLTPAADADTAGIFACYTPANLIDAITQARQENDAVIVYVHWGTEYSFTLSANQMHLAKAFIDAGASAVIGSHPHILQGMEFYNGKPIVYSLGNFWFNTRSLDTGMVKLRFTGEKMTMQFVPGKQENSETHSLKKPEDKRALYDMLESVSPGNGIRIDDDGFVTKRG